eukprot:201983-Chlamydomonas_euryale.AAC.1
MVGQGIWEPLPRGAGQRGVAAGFCSGRRKRRWLKIWLLVGNDDDDESFTSGSGPYRTAEI